MWNYQIPYHHIFHMSSFQLTCIIHNAVITLRTIWPLSFTVCSVIWWMYLKMEMTWMFNAGSLHLEVCVLYKMKYACGWLYSHFTSWCLLLYIVHSPSFFFPLKCFLSDWSSYSYKRSPAVQRHTVRLWNGNHDSRLTWFMRNL